MSQRVRLNWRERGTPLHPAVRATLRGIVAAALVVAGSALASAHLGVLALVVGAALCLVLLPPDGLVDRLMAFLAMVAALLVLACLAGPVWPLAFSPAILGGAVMVPGAVGLAVGLRPRRVSRTALARDAAVVMAAVVTAFEFAATYLSGSRATSLAAMFRGGTDYLAHYDYLQNVWVHHGFGFVRSGGPFAEAGTNMGATPTGFEAVWSALGVLLTGRDSLPGPYQLLDYFTAAQVQLAALLALTTVWALSRILRGAGVGVAASLPLLVFMAATTAVGPFASLVVSGFDSFTFGLALTAIAIGFAITTSATNWRLHGLAVWAAAAVGGFTYTFVIPVVGLLWLVHLQLARPAWRLSRHDQAYVLGASVLLGCALAAATLTVVPSGWAIANSGGIHPLPRGLLLASALVGVVVALLAGRRLPPGVRILAALCGVVGVGAAAFAVSQVVTVGAIHYYAEKVGYVWLLLALLTVAAEAAFLLDLLIKGATVGRLKPVLVLVTCVAAAWSFGYIGPGMRRVTPQVEALPEVTAWSEAARLTPSQQADEAAAATAVLENYGGVHDGLPLLWEQGVGTRENRWMAVLGGRWDRQTDDLILTLGVIDCRAGPLVTWLRAHPRQKVALLTQGPECVQSALRASRSSEPGQVSMLPLVGGGRGSGL